MPRFFITAEHGLKPGDTFMITGDDARHISFSLRMAKGDPLTVCDMARNEYSCIIDSFAEHAVSLHVVSVNASENEPPYSLTLYQALPKGTKFETIVQKSVENGVSRIIPFVSSRCVSKPSDKRSDNKTERYNRISSEAAKQCGRAIIPEVCAPVDFRTAVSMASGSAIPIFCYEGDGTVSLRDFLEGSDDFQTISVVIGPEGGFSSEEVEFARKSGMVICGLGRRILRCETASSFVLACISYRYEL